MTAPQGPVTPSPLARPRRAVPALGRLPRGGTVVVVAVTALVGFLLVGQMRGTERFSQRLEAESEGDLARILSSLTREVSALRDEKAALELRLAALEASSQRDEEAAVAAREQLAALQVLAGTVPVLGPGVVVSVDDPRRVVGYDALIDLVQELRDAGAEALAVDGRRLGVDAAFAERDGRVLLDGDPLTSPYRIEAIGDPATLEGGLAIKGGVLDTLRVQSGVRVTVGRRAELRLPAVEEPPTFRAGRPVGER